MNDENQSLIEAVRAYGMKVLTLTLENPSDAGSTRNRKFRVIVPPATGWPDQLFRGNWKKGAKRSELVFAERLASIQCVSDLSKRRNLRRIEFSRLRKESWYSEQRKAMHHWGPPEDLVLKLIGKVSRGCEDLLAAARYARPLQSAPLNLLNYAEFASMALHQIEAARDRVALALANSRAPEAVQAAARAEITPRYLRSLLRTWSTLAAEDESKLRRLGERAESILMGAMRRDLDNPTSPSRTWFEWAEVDELLLDAENTLRSMSSDDSDSEPDDEAPEALAELRLRGSTSEKAVGVACIWMQCRDRGDLLEHFLLDVERAMPHLVGRACRQLYRDVRQHLTRTERRLFALMYFPRVPMFGAKSPWFLFDGLTLFFDPVLLGVLSDPKLVGLIVMGLGERKSRTATDDLARALESRFKAYLTFYPYWVATIRDEERVSRKQRRGNVRQGRRSARPIETIADSERSDSSAQNNWMSVLAKVTGNREFKGVLGRFGIEDQRGICEAFWMQGKTQFEIARSQGISQQAVSAKLRRTMALLLAALKQHGVVSRPVTIPKRRWLRLAKR